MPRAIAIVCAALTACAPPPQEKAPAPPAPAESARSATAARVSESIRFDGFGPAPFGAPEEAVRQAWGRELEDSPPAEGSTCRYLLAPTEKGKPYPIAFMIEEGRFVRLDVQTADYLAPGGGRVGMSAAEIRELYAGRLEEAPHKYVEGGKYLIVAPEGGGPARLVFAADAAGQITSWRVGLPPQVHYVEGCS